MASDGENQSPATLNGSSAGLIPCSENRLQEPKRVSELGKSTAKEGGKRRKLDAPERGREPFKAIENFLPELGAHQTSLTWLESLEAETVNPAEIGNFLPELEKEHTYLTWSESSEAETLNQEDIWNFLPELGAHQTSLIGLEFAEAETINPEEIGNFLPELGEQQTSLTWLESSEAETVNLEEIFLQELEAAQQICLTWLEFPEDEIVNPEEIENFLPELGVHHTSLTGLEFAEAETINPEEIGDFLPELGEQQTSLTWLESSEAETVNLEEIFLQELEAAQQICLTWLEFPEDEIVNPEEIENFHPELGAEHTSLTWLESSEAEIETQKEDVDEIDLPDVNNVQSGVQYIKQLYAFYNEQQHVGRPTDYMRYRTEINAGMRVKLVRALILVHSELHLQPETLYLAVSIIDRFLSLHHVPRTQLHVVGISSLLIATKYEEDWVPKVCKFICVSGAEFSNEELCFYEKEVLNTLDWYLTVPTVYMFLIRFVKAAKADDELEDRIYYYGRMGLMEYSLILYCPSMVAAATVYAARCTLRRNPLWTDTLQRHTSYSESQLLDCANIIIRASINH